MRLERPLNNNKSNIPFCSVCDEEEWELLEESICKCKNCNLYLCDIHTKIHKKKSTTKDHTLEYLNSSSTTSSPTTTLSNNNKQVLNIDNIILQLNNEIGLTKNKIELEYYEILIYLNDKKEELLKEINTLQKEQENKLRNEIQLVEENLKELNDISQVNNLNDIDLEIYKFKLENNVIMKNFSVPKQEVKTDLPKVEPPKLSSNFNTAFTLNKQEQQKTTPSLSSTAFNVPVFRKTEEVKPKIEIKQEKKNEEKKVEEEEKSEILPTPKDTSSNTSTFNFAMKPKEEKKDATPTTNVTEEKKQPSIPTTTSQNKEQTKPIIEDMRSPPNNFGFTQPKQSQSLLDIFSNSKPLQSSESFFDNSANENNDDFLMSKSNNLPFSFGTTGGFGSGSFGNTPSFNNSTTITAPTNTGFGSGSFGSSTLSSSRGFGSGSFSNPTTTSVGGFSSGAFSVPKATTTGGFGSGSIGSFSGSTSNTTQTGGFAFGQTNNNPQTTSVSSSNIGGFNNNNPNQQSTNLSPFTSVSPGSNLLGGFGSFNKPQPFN
ncbi:hypothetical protein ABK040_012526 [Willaertia magna]